MTIAFKKFDSPAAAVEGAVTLSFSLQGSLQATTGIRRWHFEPDVEEVEEVRVSRMFGASFGAAMWERLTNEPVGVTHEGEFHRLSSAPEWGIIPPLPDGVPPQWEGCVRLHYSTFSSKVQMWVGCWGGEEWFAVVANQSSPLISALAADAMKGGWRVVGIPSGIAAIGEAMAQISMAAAVWAGDGLEAVPAVEAALDALWMALAVEVGARFPRPERAPRPVIEFDEEEEDKPDWYPPRLTAFSADWD